MSWMLSSDAETHQLEDEGLQNHRDVRVCVQRTIHLPEGMTTMSILSDLMSRATLIPSGR